MEGLLTQNQGRQGCGSQGRRLEKTCLRTNRESQDLFPAVKDSRKTKTGSEELSTPSPPTHLQFRWALESGSICAPSKQIFQEVSLNSMLCFKPDSVSCLNSSILEAKAARLEAQEQPGLRSENLSENKTRKHAKRCSDFLCCPLLDNN